ANSDKSGKLPKKECSNCRFICNTRQVAANPSAFISLLVSSGKKLPSKLGQCQFDFIVASVSFPTGRNFIVSLVLIFESKEKEIGAVEISFALVIYLLCIVFRYSVEYWGVIKSASEARFTAGVVLIPCKFEVFKITVAFS